MTREFFNKSIKIYANVNESIEICCSVSAVGMIDNIVPEK
jgi:hypothetical protein